LSRRIALARLTVAACAVLFHTTPAAAQELAGSWRFDEGAGTVALDGGPFGLHGVWPAGGGPEWIGGVEGSALRFDGDDEVALPDNAALEPPRITVAAWVRATRSPGAYRYVISKGASSCLRSAYGLYTGRDGGAAFYVAGNGSYTLSPQAPAAAVWDGRWHRLVGTYDGARVRLYLDGAEVGTGAAGPTHIEYGLASRAPYIGTYRGNCRLPFDGDVDGVAVWRGALGAARVADDALPPADTGSSVPIGPAPGAARPGQPGFPVKKGSTTTPARCTSVRLRPRAVRVTRRTRVVAIVRRGHKRRAGVRVVIRAAGLRKARTTDARGRVRFVVRAARRHRRLRVRVAVRTRGACGRPVAYVRVRR
jgi:hypothetical protein